MRLGIFCNFGPPCVGGSEFVIHNVAKHLVEHFGYEVNIYHYHQLKPLYEGKITILPCGKGEKLISQINENDHIWVYSDFFWGWDTILKNIDKVAPRVSVALTGAYYMRSHPESNRLFSRNKEKFNIITHSVGEDYDWCQKKRLEVKTIPNGVNLKEFKDNKIDFRKKYNIKEKYVLLNVANYFYGKGQEALGLISKRLRQIKSDFIVISISNTIQYPYDKSFLARAKSSFEGDKSIFLRDISRKDVVAAFKCADIFVFTSRKEVAPLVILESRAAGLPWISMDVGNLWHQKGGILLRGVKDDAKGWKVIDDTAIDKYASNIKWFIEDISLTTGQKGWRNMLKADGQSCIKAIDWASIVPMYHKVFSS